MTVYKELEVQIRQRGVRVRERLALLAQLQDVQKAQLLSERIEQQERAMRDAMMRVRDEFA